MKIHKPFQGQWGKSKRIDGKPSSGSSNHNDSNSEDSVEPRKRFSEIDSIRSAILATSIPWSHLDAIFSSYYETLLSCDKEFAVSIRAQMLDSTSFNDSIYMAVKEGILLSIYKGKMASETAIDDYLKTSLVPDDSSKEAYLRVRGHFMNYEAA